MNFQSLNLSHQESLTRLENELLSTCKDSVEDPNQLRAALSYLTQIVGGINQKLETLLETVE